MLRVVSDVVVQPLTGSYYIGYIWHDTSYYCHYWAIANEEIDQRRIILDATT